MLIDFLSTMPESWKRFDNNTKYPLKWMLNNKRLSCRIAKVPHSYIYDIDPSFSHISELVNASSFRSIYIDELNKNHSFKI